MGEKRRQSVVRHHTKTVIDQLTGEQIETIRTTEIHVGKEPSYVKLYLDTALTIAQLPKGLTGILMYMLQKMDYENTIFINLAMKKDMSKRTGIGLSTIKKALSQLTKAKVMARVDVGMYIINPYLFGKGEWKDISKIRLNVEFSEYGVKMNTKIDKGEPTNLIDLQEKDSPKEDLLQKFDDYLINRLSS